MNYLATLGIAVDSSPAAKAASDLDKMTSAAERAEDAVVGLIRNYCQFRENRRAAAKGFAQEQEQRALAATEHIGKVRDEFLNNEQKREKEIVDYRRSVEDLRAKNPNSALLEEKKIAQDIANIRDKYKNAKAPAAGAVDLSAFNDAENQLKAVVAE
jgi:hypothetical protein